MRVKPFAERFPKLAGAAQCGVRCGAARQPTREETASMLKKKLVPTPLLDRSGPSRRVEIAPVSSTHSYVLYVLKMLWRIFVLMMGLMALSFSGKKSPRLKGRLLKRFLEKMGGLWIKPGQLLATRRDIFPPEVCDELSTLQERVKGFPAEIARRRVEEELRRPLEDVFVEFSDIPVAAASVGQVHQGRLRHNGERVAIKVQRPDIEGSFKKDMAMLHLLAKLLDKTGVAPHVPAVELANEVERILREEIDYRYEATNLKHMRKNLRGSHIYVPKVHKALCTRYLVVMEFVEAVSMADYIATLKEEPQRLLAWREENHVNHRKVGRRLFETVRRQLFEDNLFHGDLHPGNILLLRDSRLCLIDFGAIGTLDASFHRKYLMCERAMLARDYTRAVELMMLLFRPVPAESVTPLKEDLVLMIKEHQVHASIRSVPYEEKTTGAMMTKMVKIFTHYKVSASSEFMRINRTQVALDASLMNLIPHENLAKLTERYWHKAEGRLASKLLRPGRPNLYNTLEAARLASELPNRLAESLPLLTERIRSEMLTIRDRVSKASLVFATLTGIFTVALVLGTLLLALACVEQYRRAWAHEMLSAEMRTAADTVPDLSDASWVLIFLAAFFLLWKLSRLRKAMLRPEVPD
jgi:ubiquinone biosynthesis protein